MYKSERTFCLACAWLEASPFRTCVSYASNSTSTLSSQAHSSSCVECSRLASCSAWSRVLATSALSLVMSWYLALMASNLSWIIKTSSPRISKACHISWKGKKSSSAKEVLTQEKPFPKFEFFWGYLESVNSSENANIKTVKGYVECTTFATICMVFPFSSIGVKNCLGLHTEFVAYYLAQDTSPLSVPLVTYHYE